MPSNKMPVGLCKNARYIVEHLEHLALSFTLYGSDAALWNKAVIDSRNSEDYSFFVGLSGEKGNGGDFAHEALRRGARVILVEHAYARAELIQCIEKNQAALICVDDALASFEKLAHSVRMREGKNTRVIGVTGSAGKTITKEMLRAILGATGSEGNLNTVQGLCMSILNSQWVREHECTNNFNEAKTDVTKTHAASYAVFECGISYENEMPRLARILQPDCAVITNVGTAHIGHFASLARLQEEKLAIASCMTSAHTLWLPEDDAVLLEKAGALQCTVRTHGFKSCAGFVNVVDKGLAGSVLEFENDSVIALPMPGVVNARNALAALELADFFSIPRKESFEALAQCSSIARRYELVHERPLIVDDSYNANTSAMVEALLWFFKNAQLPYLLVLGGMKELGSSSAAEHRRVVDALVAVLSRMREGTDSVNVVLVGTEYDEVAVPQAYEHMCMRAATTREACACIKGMVAKQAEYGVSLCDFSVLLKGSNAYALNHVADYIIDLTQELADADITTTMHTSAVN